MTTWLYYGWLTASAVFIVLTWLPLSRNTAWWVRVWEFPRLQAAIWGLLLVVTGVTLPVPSPLLNTAVLLTLSAAIVWHLWWILPYTRWYKREVPDHGDTTAKASISLLTANVLTPNRKAPELISLIKRWKPDLVLTLESDHWWEEQLIGLQSDYPHTVFHPLDNLYGIHLYSRLPLIDPEVQFLVEPNVPSIHTLIDLGQGQQIRAHFLHPAPPSPTENLESIERDAELLVVAKSVHTRCPCPDTRADIAIEIAISAERCSDYETATAWLRTSLEDRADPEVEDTLGQLEVVIRQVNELVSTDAVALAS